MYGTYNNGHISPEELFDLGFVHVSVDLDICLQVLQISMFLATLTEKLSEVRGEDVNVIMEWLRGKLSSEVLRSALLFLKGSKKPWYKNELKILAGWKNADRMKVQSPIAIAL